MPVCYRTGIKISTVSYYQICIKNRTSSSIGLVRFDLSIYQNSRQKYHTSTTFNNAQFVELFLNNIVWCVWFYIMFVCKCFLHSFSATRAILKRKRFSAVFFSILSLNSFSILYVFLANTARVLSIYRNADCIKRHSSFKFHLNSPEANIL